jgi:hypothetical protein
MSLKEFLTNHLEDILEIARFAPSVHNTQPWIVTIKDETIVVAIDSLHRLKDGDPTGRETIISLGIFAEAVCIAANELGLVVADAVFKDEVAVISFEPNVKEQHSTDETKLLMTRTSDRSIYKHTDIAPEVLTAINNARIHPRTKIITSSDQLLIKKVAELTSKGIQLALSSPSFRKELSTYLVIPGSHKQRGIATKSLYIPRAIQLIEPWLLKSGFANSAEVKLEKHRWESASGLVFICTEGDLHKDWFEVGRSYLQASLQIEKSGLSQATSAAIVEASDFHEDIEKILGSSLRIQTVIRIGKGKEKRFRSPRVTARELMATSN